MDWLVKGIQLVIALGLLNVWLLRARIPTSWRGGDSKNMREEFAAYGLPSWFMWVIGFLKVTCAILLLVGLWVTSIARPAAIGVAVLMLGAIAMHFKTGDPLKKSLPAISVLVLSLIVVISF